MKLLTLLTVCASVIASAAGADTIPLYGVSIDKASTSDASFTIISLPSSSYDAHESPLWSLPKYANIAALGYFQDATETNTGWGVLELHSNPFVSDYNQSYAAGLLEGALTANRIYQHNNNVGARSRITPAVSSFLTANSAFLSSMTSSQSTSQSPFWYQVALTLSQVDGLYDGYLQGCKEVKEDICTKLDKLDFLLIQLLTDLDDLIAAIDDTGALAPAGSRCSALIRLLPDFSDLYVAHTTWFVYQSLLKVWKLYDFNFRLTEGSEEFAPGNRQSFCSYPGTILSGDDFYITNQQLVIIETTTGNSNSSLYKYVTPQTVFYWQRNLAANRLARTAPEWVSTFSQFNSGTYNNEWLIVDLKQFNAGAQGAPADLLWIADQIPGTVEAHDMTALLYKQSYVPSYNIPIFESIRNISGFNDVVIPGSAPNSNSNSYSKCPRALIFRRDAPLVSSLADMERIIRYNDYQHDPLSLGSPSNQIACRADLSPIFPDAFGATDAKIAVASDIKKDGGLKLPARVQAGPSHDDEAPFQWSTSGLDGDNDHLGHFDLYNFNWTTTNFLG